MVEPFSPLLIRSTPALAAALRTMDPARFAAPSPRLRAADRLVPMYQVPASGLDEEAAAAAHVVSAIAERLRRLATAYAEWELFDAPAYFDLSQAHSAEMVRLVERVNTVHVVFFADLLLPSLHRATAFWLDSFAPAFAQIRNEPQTAAHLYHCLQPEMVKCWQQLLDVIRLSRTVLAEDVGFLSANGANEERSYWRASWNTPARPGLDASLTPLLTEVPTLTLTVEFALPAHRQPGRLRRLRTARARR
ncbi:MAG TPA: hypothetical protein PKE45_05670, partial [Caldilineaceae bacterium]|nr:hypothetical protein [Caldilineaceae bacterium]